MSDTDADLTALIADVRAKAARAAWGWGADWTSVTEQSGLDSEWSTVHAAGKRDMVGCEDPDVIQHIARMDPATTLRLVDAVERLTRERDEVRAAIVELAPADEVEVDGNWFRRADLPRLLENHMRAAATAQSDAKAWSIRAEAAEAEAADLRTRVVDVRALPPVWWSVIDDMGRTRTPGTTNARSFVERVVADLRRALDGPQEGGEGR